MSDDHATHTDPPSQRDALKSSYVDYPTRSILSTVEIDGEWWIDTVRVLPKHRGKGIAQKLLAEVLDDADRLKITLRLRVHPNTMDLSALTYEQLVAWYARHGFTLDQDDIHMVRQPT